MYKYISELVGARLRRDTLTNQARDTTMTTQIALFRGLNVGKANRIAMADLKRLFENLGFRDVRTLLNSGNVVFEAGRFSTLANVERIMKAISDIGMLSVRSVIVVDKNRLREIIDANPFVRRIDDPSQMLVGIFADAVDPAPFKTLETMADGDFRIGAHACYLLCPDGILASPVADTLLGAKFRDVVTTRNWATMLKLQAMLAD